MTKIVNISLLKDELDNIIDIQSVDWEVSTDSKFNNIIIKSYDNTLNKKNYSFIKPNNITDFYVRARIKTNLGYMDWIEIKNYIMDLETPILEQSIIENRNTDKPIINIINIDKDLYKSSTWYVTDENNNVVYYFFKEKEKRNFLIIPKGYLELNKEYNVYCKLLNDNKQSKYGKLKIFIEKEFIYIKPPSFKFNQNPFFIKTNNIGIFIDSFNVIEGSDKHISTTWTLLKNSSDNIVWKSDNNTIDKNYINLDTSLMETNETYIIKAKLNGLKASSYESSYVLRKII